MDAADLRRQIINKRKHVPERERSQNFRKILGQLLTLPEFNSAKSIIAYYGKSSSGEFDTLPLLNHIIQSSITLFLPRCRDNRKGLDIYEIVDLQSDTELGSYGITEPKINFKTFRPFEELDEALIIVPGSVFDRSGNRYGYGGGFYDRFLSELKAINGVIPTTVAFAHSFVVIDGKLETKPTDIPIDIIITEREIIYAR